MSQINNNQNPSNQVKTSKGKYCLLAPAHIHNSTGGMWHIHTTQFFNTKYFKQENDGQIEVKGLHSQYFYACQSNHDVTFVQELWQSGLFSISDTDTNGETALMKKETFIKFLLNIPEMDQ